MQDVCAACADLVLQVSDTLRRTDSFLWQFRSLQLSLLLCCFIAVVGGAFFLATAVFIEKDRHRAETYDTAGEVDRTGPE